MVSCWSVHNPLTFRERKLIKEAIDLDFSYREMAIHVGRAKSTVMREAKRLGDVSKYNPVRAQKDFERIQMQRRKNHIIISESKGYKTGWNYDKRTNSTTTGMV